MLIDAGVDQSGPAFLVKLVQKFPIPLNKALHYVCIHIFDGSEEEIRPLDFERSVFLPQHQIQVLSVDAEHKGNMMDFHQIPNEHFEPLSQSRVGVGLWFAFVHFQLHPFRGSDHE